MAKDEEGFHDDIIESVMRDNERGWTRPTPDTATNPRGQIHCGIEDRCMSKGIKLAAILLDGIAHAPRRIAPPPFETEGVEFYKFLERRLSEDEALDDHLADTLAFQFAVAITAAVLCGRRRCDLDVRTEELAELMRPLFQIEVFRNAVVDNALNRVLPLVGEFLHERKRRTRRRKTHLGNVLERMPPSKRRMHS